ncbi:cytochrome P450 [Parasphingorhabdus sp.]|uniref:cytochrome P450 n=1 Tax=Parasphingorhabdus sp. TaxID=2709688 RepID=UPI003002328B
MNEAVSKSLFQPDVLVDPFDFYEEKRAKSPVFFDEASGTYVVLDYDLISEAVGRLDDFSNNFNALLSGGKTEEELKNDEELQAIQSKGWPQVNTLLTADQPVHTRFRKLVNLAFSMPKVNKLEDSMREMSNELIDNFIDKGACEFVEEYAIPMPVRTIAVQLGLDVADAGTIKRWTNAFVDRLSGMMTRERQLETEREVVEYQHALKANMDERRKEAKSDILSDLVNAQVDGERPLDDAESLSIVQQLMVAGNETTTAALAEGMRLFATNPDQYRKIQDDPSLIPNAVEEVLRMSSGSSGIWRVMHRDAELGGVMLPKGAMVMMRYHAANRDPKQFENPNEFRVDRKNARTHLAFGKGIHMCVGNMLSRKEMTVSFQQFAKRIDNIRIPEGAELRYPPNMMLRGLANLPILFDKK